MKPSLSSRLHGALRALLGLLVALVLVFEEWGWEPLATLVARLGRIGWWARLERWIATRSPPVALGLFGLPVVALFPLKLLALYGIAHGHAIWGVLVIVVAKLAGTALVARLFQLTQPALMRMPWFARLHDRWKTFKDGLLARLRASRAWRWGRALKRQTSSGLGRLWRRLRGTPPA